MKKNLFRWLIALAVVLPCLLISVPAASTSSGTFGDLSWQLNGENLVISGTGEMSYAEDVPWHSYRDSISTVSIGAGVTSIGDYAFYDCTNLTSVTIPDSVTNIGSYAFYGCTDLNQVTLPRVLWIGDYAFYGCKGLATATLSDDMERIGAYAFSGCEKLTGVTIPNSVTSIGAKAFYGCTGLKTVTIGSGVKSVGESVFSGCTGLASVSFQDGATYIWDKAFYNCASLTSVEIPDTVERIGAYAFYGCTKLTMEDIPSSVTNIGMYAFYDCTGLTNVTIPSGVTGIGYYAFGNCTGLTNVTIPSGVTGIGPYMFYGCANLNEVLIPASVISMGASAFGNCSGLTGAEFMGDAPSGIGADTFEGCNKGLTITCYAGTDGWTDGDYYDDTLKTWYGYPLEIIANVYTVEVIDASNGIVKVDTEKAPAGTVVTVTVTPADGYYLYAILLDGVPISGNTFKIEKDHEVTAIFKELSEIYAASLTLEGELDMNFYYEMSNIDSGSDGYYAIAERSYADGRADDEQVIPMSQWEKNGDSYRIVYDGLAAKEMCDTIKVTIFDSNGTPISKTREDSIRMYAKRVLGSDDPKLKEAHTMIVDMLNYGAAAQEYFGYATNDLANAELTTEQQKLATQTSALELKDKRAVSPETNKDKVYGSNLELENEIVLNFYFTGMTDGMKAKVTYTDHYLQERTVSLDPVKKSGIHKVSVDGLAVADGNTMVTCTVYYADGVTPYVTVTDSMNSYLARARNGNPELMESIAKFISSTYQYMHRDD